MGTRLPVTVTGPHGDFQASRVEFDRLWKGRKGYKLKDDPNPQPTKTPAASAGEGG